MERYLDGSQSLRSKLILGLGLELELDFSDRRASVSFAPTPH